MSLLQMQGVTAGYTEIDILNGVDVTVSPGELVCVCGPNGAGKSTLLKALFGLVDVRAGRVTFDGRDITARKPHEIVEQGLGYVPQLDNVFGSMSVSDNLEIGATPLAAGLQEALERIFDIFPVLAERRRARASTLSGGQRQMLAFARALMPSPRLLALDEPSAGLAPLVVEEIFATIESINASGVAVLLVEQNARRALGMASRGYILETGVNRFEGAGPDLLADPKVVELYLGGRGA